MTRGGIAIALLLTAASGGSAVAADLRFDRVFDARGEPAALHARILYRAGDAVHHMELWRDGDRRIARTTDGRLATYAAHAPGDPGYRLSVLDLDRRIRTDIDRTGLYRIGNFSDWYDLAHGLRHPKGRYRLTTLASPAIAVKPAAPCRWYALSEGSRTSDICWDAARRLPMLIAIGGMPVWRVVSVDTRTISASRFAIHDAGFARYDAVQDIERD